MIPTSTAVTNVVVRVTGIVHTRLDLTHAGTPDQMLGLSLGTVIAYLRSAPTARKIADGWAAAAVLADTLTPAITGRSPVVVGQSTVAVMARLAGSPMSRPSFTQVAQPPPRPPRSRPCWSSPLDRARAPCPGPLPSRLDSRAGDQLGSRRPPAAPVQRLDRIGAGYQHAIDHWVTTIHLVDAHRCAPTIAYVPYLKRAYLGVRDT